MTWGSQVLHVARKDVRALRWPIAAYAVLVAACTAISAGAMSIRSSGLALAGGYDVLAFLILTGALVHEDSPTSVRAFWATRPFSPSAVLGAKALVAVVVLGGIAFVGQVVDLVAYRVPVGAVVGSLAPSLQVVLVVTVFPLLLATVSPGMPGFVGLLIVAIIGDVAGVSEMISWGEGLTGVSALLVAGAYVIAAIGITGVAVSVYRSHDPKRAQWVTLVLAAAPFISGIVPRQPIVMAMPDQKGSAFRSRDGLRGSSALESNADDGMATRPNAARPSVRATATFDDGSPGQTYLSVATRVDSAPGSYRYLFRATGARMIRHDGSTKTLVVDGQHGGLGGAGQWADPSVAWLGSPELVDVSSVDVDVTAEERDAFHRGEWRLAIEGLVDVREPVLMIEMPLDTGYSITKDGFRVRLVESGGPLPTPLVATREAMVSASVLTHLALGPTSVSLRNDRLQQGIRLMDEGGSYDRNLYFPIPSVIAFVVDRIYHTADFEDPSRAFERPDKPQVRVEAAWMKDARLRFDQWILVGDYPASIVADAGVDKNARSR